MTRTDFWVVRMESNGEGWMLPNLAFEMIERRLDPGSTIYELGSGVGSNRLHSRHQLTSVEHDPIWCDSHPGNCIHAPIEPNVRSAIVGEKGWYSSHAIESLIGDGSRCDLLIVDGPTGEIGRSGVLAHPKLLHSADSILVDDTHRAAEHSLALAIAEVVRGTITMHASDQIQYDGTTRCWAWIENGGAVDPPDPIDGPDVSGILPEGMAIRRPQGVGNDHSWIEAEYEEKLAEWTPHLGISIVIPLYNRKKMLGRTLSALTHQTYPLDLMEVVIADDGSDDGPGEMIDGFSDRLEIVIVRQEDRGYRLSEVRNLGIRAARNDHVILLDCDMAPVPRFVEAYARRLSITDRAVFCGHRRYVDANHIEVEELDESLSPLLALPDIETANLQVKGDAAGPTTDWRLPIYQRSDNLRWEPHPFRAVCGGNIGFHRSIMDRAGWFDEAFTAWGAEDTEWGFRVWNTGHWIVPLMEGCGLHQEPPGGRNETDREAGKAISHPMLIDRCPLVYRKPEHGSGHEVPLVSIYMPAHNAVTTIVDAIDSALDQTIEDLEICVVDDGSTDGTSELLESTYGEEPRVRIAKQENRGIGAASNAAVRMCKGVFIGQLDADDMLQPDAVATLLSRIRRDTRLGVVYGSHQMMNASGEVTGGGYVWDDYSREKLTSSMMIHHMRLFRSRDWWRTVGFAEDIENAVDYDMFLKLSEVTEFEHLHKWTYLYRSHEGSTSVNKKALQDRNNRIVVERALRRRGLAGHWSVDAPDPEHPRRLVFTAKEGVPPQEESEQVSVGSTPPLRRAKRELVHRLRIGSFDDLQEFQKAVKRVRRFRRSWTFHTDSRGLGIRAPLAIITGRLSPERAESECERFRAKFPEWSIEIARGT